MQQPCGSTWEGHSPKYKVWDLCMTLEPLIDLQARLDAYGAMLPLQAGAFVNACVTAGRVPDTPSCPAESAESAA